MKAFICAVIFSFSFGAAASSVCIVSWGYSAVYCDGKTVGSVSPDWASLTAKLKELTEAGYKIVTQADGSWTLVK